MELQNLKYDFYENYDFKMRKEVYTTKGLSGLINCGNKCYLNSIIQCLSNSLLLTDYFISNEYKEDLDTKKHKNEHYILNSYVSVINNIWDTNQIIHPKSLIENLGKFHRKYFSTEQQDSHECLLYILDLLHHSLSYQIELSLPEINKNDVLTKKSLETWKSFYEKEYSFIIKIFNGNLINYITCNNLKCNFSDEIFEPFNTISVDLTDTLENFYTLKKCIDNYFKDKFTIESWKCKDCNSDGCNKSVKLWSMPNYLIIHLNRFKFNEITNTFDKNKSNITFPLENLNFSEYISTDKSDKNNYIYDLYSVNYHTGDINDGHYTSSCKNLDNEWYLFNDGNTSRYNSKNIESHIVNSDAYILFYIRKIIKQR